MAESLIVNNSLKIDERYSLLESQIYSLLDPKDSLISSLSNFCAALKQSLNKISWVGFYFFDGNKLFLGPFQGKVACTNILIGTSVCGISAKEKRTIVVPNVYEFPGHIFCDADSKSEIVIPILINDSLFGVLDVDSSDFNSFNDIDKFYLEKFCDFLANNIIIKNKFSL